MYIMDQHAAHEKVMFERLMRQMSEKNVISQQLLPPKVVHLDSAEHALVISHMDLVEQTGFDWEISEMILLSYVQCRMISWV